MSETLVGPKNLAELEGPYSRLAVDTIAALWVTDAMVDRAIRQGTGTPLQRESARVLRLLADPDRRATARRNIALGLRAGAYGVE
jgi:hypothetical protein